MVNGAHEELALYDDYLAVFIVNNDGINFLVVGAIRDVVMCLKRRSQIAISQIPSQKSGAVIGRVLLVVLVVGKVTANAIY